MEGPDGAGKSNLVAKLLAAYPELVLQPKVVTSGARALTPIGPYIEEEISKGFGMRLYDRFALISSPQYMCMPQRTFREEMTDGPWLAGQYNRFWHMDPVIIFCMPPLKEVKKNVAREDTDNSVVQDDHRIETIYYQYLAFIAQNFGRFATSWLVYDYTQGEFPMERFEYLIKWARARIEHGRIHSPHAR